MFIKFFLSKMQAEQFAREHNGIISIVYDWDYLKNKMIKMYSVKF